LGLLSKAQKKVQNRRLQKGSQNESGVVVMGEKILF
jgi:hypothetical protein